MTPGYFFAAEGSLKGGVPACFRYVKIRRRAGSYGIEDYPIFVSFNENVISFYIQRSQARPDEDAYPTSAYSSTKIYSLPLTVESEAALQQTLKKIWDDNNVENQIVAAGDEVYHLIDSFSREVGFAHLEEQRKTEKTPSLSLIATTRILFLDFLFDFFYSNVFLNHPAYYKIKHKIESDEFFGALWAKFDFLYKKQREALTPDFAEVCRKESVAASLHWISKLKSKNAEQIINPNNNWFEDIEEEYKRGYDTIENFTDPAKNKKYKFIRELKEARTCAANDQSVETFRILKSLRENGGIPLTAMNLLLRLKKKSFRDNAFSDLPEGINTVIDNNKIKVIADLRLLKEETETFIAWNIDRINIWEAFKTQFTHRRYERLKGFSMVLSLIGVLLIIHWAASQYEFKFSLASIFNDCASIFFVGFLLIALIVFATALYFIINNVITKTIGSFVQLANWPFKDSAVLLPYDLRGYLSLPKLIHILRPAILLSSLAIWFGIINLEASWNISFQVRFFPEFMVMLIFFVGIAIYIYSYLDKKYIGSKSTGRKFRRSLTVPLITIGYSFIIGLYLISQKATREFGKEAFLVNTFTNLRYEVEENIDSIGKVVKVEYRDIPAFNEVGASDNQWHTLDSLLGYLDRPEYEKLNVVSNRTNGIEQNRDSTLLYRRIENVQQANKVDALYHQNFDSKQVRDVLFNHFLPQLQYGNGKRPKLLFLKAKSKDNHLLPKTVILFPDYHIFFTIICLAIGLFIELEFRRRV